MQARVWCRLEKLALAVVDEIIRLRPKEVQELKVSRLLAKSDDVKDVLAFVYMQIGLSVEENMLLCVPSVEMLKVIDDGG